ncbi:hypothetical protein U8V72_14430 [Priestia filamentosa]|uniref:hypothetical protein n=1 Tax=Priestia filamentosa TaxID=1402861 RepID=UPI00068C3190
MIGWNFPLNNYGPVAGLNDAGIESFLGNRIDSLARECIQNSTDARLDKSCPVRVTFNIELINKKAFPGLEEFNEVVFSCRDYWKTNVKAKEFFDKAYNSLNSKKIPVLKVSDYNTTGLTGSAKEGRSHWHNLIKSIGTSDKAGGAGGSFGIGKSAAFASSDLRTVFYVTKDIEDNEACQGVARLVTHYNQNRETTQGTGYFGYKEKNQPITYLRELPSFLKRKKTGTDIIVMGFYEQKNWKINVIKTVLENFLIAIYEEQLVVEVEDTIINLETLPSLLERYTKPDDKCLSHMYYQSLVSKNKHTIIEEDYEGLGRLELHFLFKEGHKKYISMTRATGMKIKDKNFRIPQQFSGIMIAKGEKLNELLRMMENPQHTNWEADRHYDEKKGKAFLKKLNTWVSTNIKSCIINNDIEEVDLEGISDYLPDNLEGGTLKKQKINSNNLSCKINIHKYKFEMKETSIGRSNVLDFENDIQKNKNEYYTLNPTEEEQEEKREGESKEKLISKGEELMGNSKIYVNKPLLIDNVRSFCTNSTSGEYCISFTSPKKQVGYLYVNIVGEQTNELAKIKNVKLKGCLKKAEIVGKGKVGPIYMLENKKISLFISLQNNTRCALEVILREN